MALALPRGAAGSGRPSAVTRQSTAVRLSMVARPSILAMSNWTPGTLCWTPDAQRSYVEGRIVSVKSGIATVELEEGAGGAESQRTCGVLELLPRAREKMCCSDMDELPELNMACVLDNVEMLFGQEQNGKPGVMGTIIYSSVGPILIALNPFQNLPIYGPDWVEAFHAAGKRAKERKKLGPHCFGTAENAYHGMRGVRQQSVVICGESGAGKTVTNRKMLEYLCEVASEKGGGKKACDPEQIAKANMLLESFGNAKTVRNDNSSRFGKYQELSFDEEKYHVQGCEVEHYLLERSRVVAQPRGERNYHIFYQLTRADIKSELHLGGPEDYVYARSGADVEGFDDVKDFADLQEVMTSAGFSAARQRSFYEAIAAVLHMGNVELEGDGDKSNVKASSRPSLDLACQLLGLDAAAFVVDITQGILKVGKEEVKKMLSKEQAQAQRDAISKMVYSRVFDRIVADINNMLGKHGSSFDNQDADKQRPVVGLLDIFGFEDMPINGFEQMFINLTNERIQFLFNSIMFEKELEAYRQEGIPSTFDPGPSNWPCIELFTSLKGTQPGVVRLLRDQCNADGKDGAAFAAKLNKELGKHSHFAVCTPQMVSAKKARYPDKKMAPVLDYRECFEVRHYAGNVLYTVDEFLARSRDSLLPHLEKALSSSSKPEMAAMFGDEGAGGADGGGDKGGKAATKDSTVGERFVRQLEVLGATLDKGECHFVRCIKSNPGKVPLVVNRPMVLDQLNCGGVVAALEMRQRGYPDRLEYRQFANEFRVVETQGAKSLDAKRRTQMLLEDFVGVTLNRNLYVFGSSKVFMKSSALAFMRACVNIKMTKVTTIIRRAWREFKGTARIKSVEEAWEKLQEAIEIASERGVDAIKRVKDALAEGQDQIGRVWNDLVKAKARHGEDVHKIGLSLKSYDSMLVTILKKAEDIMAVVEKIADRKAAAEQILSSRITKASAEGRALQERLVAVEEDVADLEVSLINPEQKATYDAAVLAAKSRLEAISGQELPDIRSRGPIALGFDLETDQVKGEADSDDDDAGSPKMGRPSQGPLTRGHSFSRVAETEGRFDNVPIWEEIAEKLKDAVALVVKVEECGNILTAVRRDFANRAPEFLARFVETQEKLEAVAAEAQELMAEGLDGIGEALDIAWKKQEHILELKHAAQDLDGFRESVESFEAMVVRLGDSVQKGHKWVEQCAVERAKQETSVLRSLTAHQGLMNDGAKCLRALVASATEIEERQRQFEAEMEATPPGTPRQSMARLSGVNLAGLDDLGDAPVISEQETLQDLLTVIRAAEAQLRKIGIDPANVPEDEAVCQHGHVAGQAYFQPKDRAAVEVWSVDHTHHLGGKGMEARYEDKAKLLDEKMVNSISKAIDGLNTGILSCPDGFCVVFSITRNAYFLLYSTDKKTEAFAAFGLYEEDP